MRRLPTRLLHLAIAVAIVHQLIVSLFMEGPRPGRAGDLAFNMHVAVGFGSLGFLAAFWLWSLVRREEKSVGALVPWFSADRRRRVLDDLRRHLTALRAWRIPEPDGDMALASAIHGLGLVTMTAMAVSGAVVYFAMQPGSGLTQFGFAALAVHSAVANLAWAYLVGHAAIALAHELAGHRIVRSMFSVRGGTEEMDPVT